MKINTKLRIKAIKRIQNKIYDNILFARSYRRHYALEGDYEKAKKGEKALMNLEKADSYWERRLKRYKKLKK